MFLGPHVIALADFLGSPSRASRMPVRGCCTTMDGRTLVCSCLLAREENCSPVYSPSLRSCLLIYDHHFHSDLKPDNILLDEGGHAHVTDFNIAVHYSERRLLTGVAGSMAYMAPEILAKRGYTYTIDWWSLGVCAYELIFGRRPFRGKTNSDLTHSISKDSLRFPEDAEAKCSRSGLQALKGVSRLLRHFLQICCKPSLARYVVSYTTLYKCGV